MKHLPQPMPRSHFVKGYATAAGWIAATAGCAFLAATWHPVLAFLAVVGAAVATFTTYQLSLCSLERPTPREEATSDRPTVRQPVGRAGIGNSRRIAGW